MRLSRGQNGENVNLMCNHIGPRLKICGTFPTFPIPIMFSYSNIELNNKNLKLPRKVGNRSFIDAETYTKITESSARPLRETQNTQIPSLLNTEMLFFFCEGKVAGE